jgi:lycopene beta-cyclase
MKATLQCSIHQASNLNKQNKYDYIITGMGCAGLSLVVRLIQSGKFADKKILLIDKDAKRTNDRTWCFWEKAEGVFESIVHQRYQHIWFHAASFSKLLDIAPYQYKLIRGIDFYDYCLQIIATQSNIEIVQATVTQIGNESNQAYIIANGITYYATYIFNSILLAQPVLKPKEHYLLQHFKGWVVETPTPAFTPAQATFMDFRVSQQFGTTFVYVMPYSETKALVEYTLFTESLLQPAQYKEGLKNYIQQFLKIDAYNIVEEEFGVIPMTSHRFAAVQGNIINIGTAGGQTKASSGYTFNFIQKHSARIVENLIKLKNPFIALPHGPSRFHFYDSTLLDILKNKTLSGDIIFSQLFKKNKPQPVLRFLDNESSLSDELKITTSLPVWPFLKAALRY